MDDAEDIVINLHSAPMSESTIARLRQCAAEIDDRLEQNLLECRRGMKHEFWAMLLLPMVIAYPLWLMFSGMLSAVHWSVPAAMVVAVAMVMAGVKWFLYTKYRSLLNETAELSERNTRYTEALGDVMHFPEAELIEDLDARSYIAAVQRMERPLLEAEVKVLMATVTGPGDASELPEAG